MKIIKPIMDSKEKLTRKIVGYFPSFITPNSLTWLRILTLPVIIALIIKNDYAWALAFFIFAFALDLFDGALARSRGQITTFGALFDPFADKLVFLTVLFLVAFRTIPLPLIYTILALELILVFQATVLKTIARRFGYKMDIGANIYGKVKMFFQFCGLVILMLGPENLFNIKFSTAVFILAVVFAICSIITHLRSIRK